MRKDALLAAIIITAAVVCAILYFSYSQIASCSAGLLDSQARSAELEANLSSQLLLVHSLSSEKSSLQADSAGLRAQVSQKDSRISGLLQSNAELLSNLSTMQSESTRLKAGVDAAQASLDDFEKRVAESNAWFKDNSNVGNVSEYRQMLFSLEFSCAEFSGDYCVIKMACPRLVHDIFKDFSYRSDESLFGRVDKLQSLAEFFDNKGGDCEDYALLVKAEMNYLKGYCAKNGRQKLQFEAATYKKDEIYYVDVPRTWYYQDAFGLQIPLDHQYYAEVCGTFPVGFDPNNNASIGYSGHCVIGFLKSPVRSSADIPSALADVLLVEPQNGRFLANQSQGVFFVPQDGYNVSDDFLFSHPSLWVVITDDDYYKFHPADAKWTGYSDIAAAAESLRASLNQTS